jgi:LAO/AO transport system kinase
VKPFFTYMLRCADGSYYVGHTDDLEHRIAQHQAGEVAGCDAHDGRPVECVWSGEAMHRDEALAFEQRIKGWTRARKEALIAEDRTRVSRPSGAHARPRPQAERHLVDAILHCAPAQRRAIAKAITLLESTRADHRAKADALLTALLPHAGRSLRLGISGAPGVGKSTFIEALGLHLVERGHRVAVLAVDPSSSVSGGSILGDKTRMQRLAADERAYVRPSPASGTLGGVAAKTRESMLVCVAAGHDSVIVETVGVGQSETAVAGMTDLFVLLQLPNAGDDLQAIKKGVMELADLVVVNKADLDDAAATRAEAQIASALRLVTARGRGDDVAPRVMRLSSLTGEGIAAFWSRVEALVDAARRSGAFESRRRSQNEAWMWDLIHAALSERFQQHRAVKARLPSIKAQVRNGEMAASTAARSLLACLEEH